MNNQATPLKEKRYWKISPGRKAKLWDSWTADGYVAIGWDDLGDLKALDREAFDERVDELLELNKTYSRAGLEQVWRFAREIKPGDVVLANRGLSEVLGYGTVTGSYFFAEGGESHLHRVPVSWDETTARSANMTGWVKTLIEMDETTFKTLVDDELKLCETPDQVLDNLRAFATQSLDRQSQVASKKYFVYDTLSGWFAPTKFACFLNMTIDRYQDALAKNPPIFCGSKTRTRAEKLLGAPTPTDEPVERLAAWLARLGRTSDSPVIYVCGADPEQKPALEVLCDEIRAMPRGGQSGGGIYHHKDFLLLAAIALTLRDEKLSYSNLLEPFEQLVSDVDENLAYDMLRPYTRMHANNGASDDPFWVIKGEDGVILETVKTDKLAPVRDTVIEWTGRRRECIEDPRLLGVVVRTILDCLPAEWRETTKVCFLSMVDNLEEIPPGPDTTDGVTYYTANPEESESMKEEPIRDLKAICSAFSNALASSHITFGNEHDEFVRAFVVSLATKGFVILTGLSGSGKTQIARCFGKWVAGESGGKYEVVPVRPDWTGAEALFGYEDALQPATPDASAPWHVPRALEFMLRAAEAPEWPYILLLDEMNLAHVERYFADVLSGMESDEPCLPNLVLGEDDQWRVPRHGLARRKLPRNLFVIGTVNVDETTYLFSPKVLDRANTLEFRVNASDLRESYEPPGEIVPGSDGLVRGFLSIATDRRWHINNPAPSQEEMIKHLRMLHELLAADGFEFGHRVMFESMRFAALAHAAGIESFEKTLDLQVMQKILPRLHGSRRRLEGLLRALASFCAQPQARSKGTELFDPEKQNDAGIALPRSFGKVTRMLRTLRINQFTSFTE